MLDFSPTKETNCFIRLSGASGKEETQVKKASFGQVETWHSENRLRDDTKISFDGRSWQRLDEVIASRKEKSEEQNAPAMTEMVRETPVARPQPIVREPVSQVATHRPYVARSTAGNMLVIVGMVGRVAYLAYIGGLVLILILGIVSFAKNSAVLARDVAESEVKDRDRTTDEGSFAETWRAQRETSDSSSYRVDPFVMLMAEMSGLFTWGVLMTFLFFHVSVIVVVACVSEGAIAAGKKLNLGGD